MPTRTSIFKSMKNILITVAIIVVVITLWYFFVLKKANANTDTNTRFDINGNATPGGAYIKDVTGKLVLATNNGVGGNGANNSGMGAGAKYEDVNWWWTAIPDNIKSAFSSVVSQVANHKFSTVHTLSGNRTKLFGEIEEEQFYKNWIAMVDGSSLLDYQKKQVKDALYDTLWNGILTDVRASRFKKLANAAGAIAKYGQGAADILKSGESAITSEQG